VLKTQICVTRPLLCVNKTSYQGWRKSCFDNFCTQFCHYQCVLLKEQGTCKTNPPPTPPYHQRTITIRSMCVADTAAPCHHPLHDASSVCNTYCTGDINTVRSVHTCVSAWLETCGIVLVLNCTHMYRQVDPSESETSLLYVCIYLHINTHVVNSGLAENFYQEYVNTVTAIIFLLLFILLLYLCILTS